MVIPIPWGPTLFSISEVSPDIKQNLEQAAHSQGIDPQRLVFYAKLPWSEYLAIGQRADQFLDTFLYNAGSTAVCVLQAGLPILTCPGESSASRLGASICKAVGLEVLICNSPQQYAEQAIYWGTHPDELRKICDHLMTKKEQLPLFQPQQWIQNLESVLQTLWQNYFTFHHSPTPTFSLNSEKTLNGGVIFSSHSSQKSSRQTKDFPPLRIVCATGVSSTDFFTETDLSRSLEQVNPPNCELYLFPENTQSLPTLYNQVIETSVTDPSILVFVHDDVQLIDPHWHTKLLKALTVYELGRHCGQ